MLSGYSIWWINLHPLSSSMYIPALFYFYERIKMKRGIGNVRGVVISSLSFSLILAFSISGGKPHVVIMGLMLLVIYSFYGEVVDGRLS